MDVFSLRDTVVGEYKQFATSFTTIFAPDIKQQIEAIYKVHGEYRPKRVVFEIYGEMAEATRTGRSYQPRRDPPPANPRVAHTGEARPQSDQGSPRARGER